MTTIGIITGSTRPGRFSIQAAQWLLDFANTRGDIDTEYVLVDIAEYDLPLFDEPVSPVYGPVQNPGAQRFAARLGELDGFIFATPEYNHSTSAALKNALDYAYGEWNFKPAGFISWGAIAGGVRAVEHVRGILGELKVYDIREQVVVPNFYLNFDEQGKYRFGEAEERQAAPMLDELVFWTAQMKAAREARTAALV